MTDPQRHDQAVVFCCDRNYYPMALFMLRQIAFHNPFRRFDFVDYFPSYEIVLNSSPALAFQDDQLHVARDMVQHVMETFQSAYLAPQK